MSSYIICSKSTIFLHTLDQLFSRKSLINQRYAKQSIDFKLAISGTHGEIAIEVTLSVMSKLPTDREVLHCIYEMYEASYPGVPPGAERGDNDPHLPIDVYAVAARLKCKPELLFGLLYYHLDAKHRYKDDSGASVPLFAVAVGTKRHAVNFPYLAALLADHNLEHRRQLLSTGLSLLALMLSVGAIIAQLATTAK